MTAMSGCCYGFAAWCYWCLVAERDGWWSIPMLIFAAVAAGVRMV